MSDFIKKLINTDFESAQIQEELKQMIQDFFENDKEKLLLNNVPEFAIIAALESVISGFDYSIYADASEWDREYCYSFSYNNKTYCFYGSSFCVAASIEETK